jgi:hypothetical protein
VLRWLETYRALGLEMSKNTYIFYMLLVAAVMMLSQIYGTAQPMNIWEFIDSLGR